MSEEETLLFVSNSNSGVLPQIKNYSDHSLASRGDGCHLSALTYSPVGMKKEWKRFIREQKLPSRVLDREEFRAEFGSIAMTFPVVLVRTHRGLSILISTEELNRCRSLEDLMDLLRQRLAPLP